MAERVGAARKATKVRKAASAEGSKVQADTSAASPAAARGASSGTSVAAAGPQESGRNNPVPTGRPAGTATTEGRSRAVEPAEPAENDRGKRTQAKKRTKTAKPTKVITKTAAAAAGRAMDSGSSRSRPTKLAKRTGATRSQSRSVSREEKAITKSAPAKRSRSVADMEKIRAALVERRDELRAEYDQTLAEIADLQRDRFTDSAGDDQADTGTKTFEREQEISLANGILERINQVERALERVADGNYGSCERCGNPIPVERLAAFPSATLCISCKQLEERR